MYENVVDVLIYLYENYLEGESAPRPDQGRLREELVQAGFAKNEIDKAFHWLDELADKANTPQYGTHKDRTTRIYTTQETGRLDLDARGLLLFLEQSNILDQVGREMVIERAMALDTSFVTVDELKWIVLLVLMNQPGQEAAFSRMEEMVYCDSPVYLH